MVVLRDFLSVERGLFTINVTSCVESVPASVRWTGGCQISVDLCTTGTKGTMEKIRESFK
jgi:hypothetical protein